MFPKPKRHVSRSAEGAAAPPPDVCRVCLGTGVRMYHMRECGLRAAYAALVGVQINTEDKLPQQLCWECVGRLSSANCFKQKALKSQQILTNIITNSKLITIHDIESVDKSLEKLESTLGTKFNTVNEYDFAFTEETVEPNNCSNMHTYTANNDRNEDISDIEVSGNEEDQFIKVEKVTSELDSIMAEQVDDEEGDIDTGNVYISDEELAIRIKQESTSDEVSGDDENVKSEVCEDINQSHKRSNNQEMVLEDIDFIIYNTEHSSKHLTAKADQSAQHIIQNMRNEFRTPIKDKLVFEEDLDMIAESSADSIEAVTLAQCSATASGSTSHTIDASTRMLILSGAEYPQKSFDHQPTLILRIQKQPKMHYCTFCSYKTQEKRNLTRHINAIHTKSEVFNCTYCSYQSYYKGSLLSHVNTKHTKSKFFMCSHCSFTAYQKKNLLRHVNTIHTKSKVFNCTYCSYQSYRKRNLLSHVNINHTKSNFFLCSHCSFIAFQKNSLLRHFNATHQQ